MFKQNVPPQLLTEAKERDSLVQQWLGRMGINLHGTLTWGAAIGAFIGPVKAVLAGNPVMFTEQNIVLLATASNRSNRERISN